MTRRNHGMLRAGRSALGWGLAAALACVVAQAVPAAAETAGQPRAARWFGAMRRAPLFGLRQLDLTEAQRTEIRSVMERHRAEFREIRERSAPVRQALGEATRADVIDEALIRHYSAQLAETQADMAVARARLRAEVLQILTPEQRAKAAELRAERDRRIAERRARRRNR